MPELVHLPAGAGPDEIADVLARDGGLIVDGVLDGSALARLKDEITPFVAATEPGRDDFTGRRTTRTGALTARSAACRELIMHPTLLGGARTFLKPFCETIQLHLTQLIHIMPGQGSQVLHRDRLAWGGFLPMEIEPQFNTIWAVTDFTRRNGATRVVPGSNRWPLERRATDDEIAYAEMTAGSVLVYSGSVIHSGGENQSDAGRMGLNITYCLGWLRQEENQYLSCPPHIAKDFAPELQALLGYSMGSYALGYFTPPAPAGEAPEVVPPEFLFNGKIGDWGEAMYRNVSTRGRGDAA